MFKRLLMLLLFVAPLSMVAQGKVAYINAEELFAKMPEFGAVQVKLKDKSTAIEQRAKAIEGEFNDLVEKFSKSEEEPTASVVADREKQLQQLQGRYQQFIQTSQVEFEQEQQKLLAPLREKLQKAIQDVGAENNYLYIADIATFMYVGNEAVDATNQVKAKLGILN